MIDGSDFADIFSIVLMGSIIFFLGVLVGGAWENNFAEIDLMESSVAVGNNIKVESEKTIAVSCGAGYSFEIWDNSGSKLFRMGVDDAFICKVGAGVSE